MVSKEKEGKITDHSEEWHGKDLQKFTHLKHENISKSHQLQLFQNLYTNVYSSIIHSILKVETIQMSVN